MHRRPQREAHEVDESEYASDIGPVLDGGQVLLAGGFQSVKDAIAKLHGVLLDEENFHVVTHFQPEPVFDPLAVVAEPSQSLDPEQLSRVELGKVEILVLRPEFVAFLEHLTHEIVLGVRGQAFHQRHFYFIS